MTIHVKQAWVKGLKGKYRVTLVAREGMFALSVPKSRLGALLLPLASGNTFKVEAKNGPVAINTNLKGIKPVRKAARKTFTYVPLRPRKTTKKKTSTTQKKSTAPLPVSKIEEVTSGLAHALPTETTPKRKRSRNKAVATAA
jgi:hypothetical protein